MEYFKPILKAVPYQAVSNAAEPIAIALVVALVSYFSLILGELAPKTIGLQFADRMSLIVAKPINTLANIGGLAVKLLTLSNRLVLALFGVKPASGQEFVTRKEVLHTVSEGGETGALTEHGHKVIENMLDFSHTKVSEIMVPRLKMVALDMDLPREELLAIIRENMYTRYSVYRKDRDNIIGFIHSKDLFLHPGLDTRGFTLEEIVRAPLYVPETKHANELLREMQRKRVQIAFVVDEYGGINGLVTTEDLLEELVGEIEDEHDAGEARRAERLADGSLLVDALMSHNDLEELLDVKFEEGLPYDTIAGLILAKLGRFPEQGEKVEWEAYDLHCEEVSATSIIKVRIVSR